MRSEELKLTICGNCKAGGSVAEQSSARGREAPSMNTFSVHTEPPHHKLKVIVSKNQTNPDRTKEKLLTATIECRAVRG